VQCGLRSVAKSDAIELLQFRDSGVAPERELGVTQGGEPERDRRRGFSFAAGVGRTDCSA
jgi:hypothetical protein